MIRTNEEKNHPADSFKRPLPCATRSTDSMDSPEFPIGQNRLNEKQQSAVDLLAAGKKYGEAARLLGIDRKTLYHWRKDEDFQAAVESRRRELWGRAGDRVRALLGPALDVLEKQLADPYDRSRYRAATAILRLANLRKSVPAE